MPPLHLRFTSRSAKTCLRRIITSPRQLIILTAQQYSDSMNPLDDVIDYVIDRRLGIVKGCALMTQQKSLKLLHIKTTHSHPSFIYIKYAV